MPQRHRGRDNNCPLLLALLLSCSVSPSLCGGLHLEDLFVAELAVVDAAIGSYSADLQARGLFHCLTGPANFLRPKALSYIRGNIRPRRCGIGTRHVAAMSGERCLGPVVEDALCSDGLELLRALAYQPNHLGARFIIEPPAGENLGDLLAKLAVAF